MIALVWIDEANLEKIFDPCFITKDEGTGLGLSNINRISEDHEGVINVKSSRGNGTLFEIFI